MTDGRGAPIDDGGARDIDLTNDERNVLLAALAEAFPQPVGASILLGQLGLYLGSSPQDGAELWRRLSNRLEHGEMPVGALRSLVGIALVVEQEDSVLLRLARRVGVLGQGESLSGEDRVSYWTESSRRAYERDRSTRLEELDRRARVNQLEDLERERHARVEELKYLDRERGARLEELESLARDHQARGQAIWGIGHEHEAIEDRTLDVEVEGSIEAGAVVLYASVALGTIPNDKALRSGVFAADLLQPAVLMVSYSGFAPRDETVAEVRMEPGRPSATVAFRFIVLPDGPYAITVSIHQTGRELARVLVDDFSASPRSQPLDPHRPPVDVYLNVTDDGAVTLLTSDLEHRLTRFDTKLLATSAARHKLDSYVARILAADVSAEVLDRELRIIGKELSHLLPGELLDILAGREDLSVLIDHPADLDFPFELALIEHGDRDSFLGERHRVTRWISPSPAPLTSGPQVSFAALITDESYLGDAETELAAHVAKLRELSELIRYENLATAREEVFGRDRFGLVDLVTHLEVRDGTAGLRFNGDYLRPGDFLLEDRAFVSSAALVFVNACSSTLTAERFYGQTSFPGTLIGLGVRSIVATVLPVEPPLALEFGTRFIEALNEVGNLGSALRMARRALVEATESEDNRARRRLAAISYCGFGHPDLTIAFTR